MADFYSGYNDARARQEKSSLAELQALTGAQALLGNMQDREAKAATLQRANAARATLASLPADASSETVLQALRPHLDPTQLAPLLQSDITHRGNRDNTRQIALARIQQANDKLDQDYQLGMAKITDANLKRGFDEWYKRSKIALEAEARAQGADKSFYETGFRRPPVALPQEGGVPGAAAPAPTMTGTAPSEAAAVAAINAGGGRPMNIEVAQAPGPVTDFPRLPYPATGSPVAPAAPAPSVQPADAGNLDARDLRARGQAAFEAAKAPVAALPATPAATKPLTLADAPADLTPKGKQQWLLQQSKPSIAGGGMLTPEALNFVAKQYLKGDRQAVQGYARNATARIALQNEIVEEAARQGMSPEAVAAQMAEYAGTVAGSRTVGQRAANISLAATEAQEMLGIVKETSDKFQRTNFIPWNMALKAYDTGTGSPEIAAFGASVNALVNVYARAINPTGVPTVSDKEHARAVINTVQSPAQVEAVLGIIRRELEIAKKAPSTVREATRQGIVGGAGGKPAADQFFR